MTMGYGNPQVTALVTHNPALLFLILSCVISSSVAQFRWEEGDWSDCSKSGCGADGKQTRQVFCMYKDSKVIEANCAHLIKPVQLRSCFKPCNNPIYEVKWAATAWSDCQLDPKFSVCSRARGEQTRSVTCVNGKGEEQDDLVCKSFRQIRLPEKQTCDLQCRQNCIVGQFSEWSSCSDCRYINKTRTRLIVVPEANGGNACPAFTDYLLCTSCSHSYFLRFTSWTTCQSFLGIINPLLPAHPLIGAQERNFECIDIFGRREDLTKCVGKFESVPVVKRQACIIAQDCILSEWSSWHLLNSSCVTEFGSIKVGLMIRQRTVKQIPLGSGKSCGKLTDYSNVSGSTIRPCPRTRWIVSGWSSCQKVNGLQQCSRGLQYRNAVCVEENEEGKQKPVDESLCFGKRPMTTQTCRSDCNWDCTVSIWSPWTDCQVTECDSYARKRRANQKTGQRYRTREMLTRPGKGGRSCLHLSETQNCDPEPCYKWRVVSGTCQLRHSTRGKLCGAGEAIRTITCINKAGELVEDHLCQEYQQRPGTVVICNIPCSDDCVLSQWREWSECPDICQKDQKNRRSYVQKRTRTILAKPPRNVGKCPPKRDLEELKNCPTIIECATYIWNTDPWGKCVLHDSTRLCGRGKQTRVVACYDTKGHLVSDKKCTIKVKPEIKQSCNVPCPQDCSLTDFSDWSACSSTCMDLSGSTVPIRGRRRYIMQYPENGGSPCPEILKEEEKCTDLPLCNQYMWETLPWSDCVLPKESCGRGLTARNVTCKSVNGSVLSLDICLRYVGQMPPVAKPCYISCDDECVFTDWSEWSSCLGGCRTKRFRQRVPKFNPDVVPPAKCSNINLYPRYEQDFCHCNDLTRVLIGEWSQCILEPPVRSHHSLLRPVSRKRVRNLSNTTTSDMGNTCGTGNMYKVVACQADNAMETADKCTLAEYEEEVCVIPCPVDCKMSEWSQWSDCPTSCGAGIQERYRHIQEWSSAGGRQCPSLDSTAKETQTRLCHPECSQFTWKTFDWNMCIPTRGSPCGHGRQSRSVSCVTINANGFTTGVVGEEKCVDVPRPTNYRDCYLPCPGDCVVTDWEEWSQCLQPCNNRLRQSRTRQVMREASVGFAPCPVLREEEPCVKGKNCMEYQWELSKWTSCLVNYGLEDCGAGHKERYPVCKNHQMQTVDDRVCLKILGPISEPLVMSCEISCDVDCLLSDWSPWSTCSKVCGLGQRIRERSIVEQYIGNGRPCPSLLTQTKPCFVRGCYRWKVSDWSQCMNQKNLCGSGMQTRNVSCVGDDGLPADSSKCEADLNILVLKTEQPCRVPCPGECVITEWSNWNECYVTCEDFDAGIKYGRQSRSRAIIAYNNLDNHPCPDQLWESRGCTASSCTYFVWKASPWNDRTRDVWCERSDGLVVSGGCDIRNKLPTNLYCQPQCVLNSYCNDTNSCVCLDNFEPVITRADNVLQACIVPNATAVTEASSSKDDSGDEATKIWMYTAVAAGTILIIVIALVLYHMSEFFQSGPRPHGNKEAETDEVESADTLTPEKATTNQNCNVCSHISAPVDTMVTRKYDDTETKLVDDVGPYVEAWNRKSFVRRAFETISRILPCMSRNLSKHVHDRSDDSKVPMADVELSEYSNGYAPFQDVSLDTESTDVVNLIHTPSYYLATRNMNDGLGPMGSQHPTKILTLPPFESPYLKNHLAETEEMETPFSSSKLNHFLMKRSQSDSAISIPNSNSTGAGSYTNSPFSHHKKAKVNVVGGNNNPEQCKDSYPQKVRPPADTEKHETEKSIIPVMIERQDSATPVQRGKLLVNGSMSIFMEDYIDKMKLPSRAKELVKPIGFDDNTEGHSPSLSDSRSENDPLLESSEDKESRPADFSHYRDSSNDHDENKIDSGDSESAPLLGNDSFDGRNTHGDEYGFYNNNSEHGDKNSQGDTKSADDIDSLYNAHGDKNSQGDTKSPGDIDCVYNAHSDKHYPFNTTVQSEHELKAQETACEQINSELPQQSVKDIADKSKSDQDHSRENVCKQTVDNNEKQNMTNSPKPVNEPIISPVKNRGNVNKLKVQKQPNVCETGFNGEKDCTSSQNNNWNGNGKDVEVGDSSGNPFRRTNSSPNSIHVPDRVTQIRADRIKKNLSEDCHKTTEV